jgi:hypothetical protein
MRVVAPVAPGSVNMVQKFSLAFQLPAWSKAKRENGMLPAKHMKP